jgi:putative ABC transport system permease protein
MSAALASSRLLPRDVLAVGSVGLRTRRLRASLSAVGIAIGIASMVAVLGISASSQADLLNTIDRLGTNLLTISAGQSFFGDDTRIPRHAEAMIASMPGIEQAAAVYGVDSATVRRSKFVDPNDTSGIGVEATDLNLPQTLSGELADGHFLTEAEQRFPAVVLGSVAAQRLGISTVATHPLVYIGGQYWTVVGILKSFTLDTSIDRSALIGLPVAQRLFSIDPNPTTIYTRADDDKLQDVRKLLAPTTSPEHPEQVEVSRPSDALEARAAAKGAFTTLLLGLGAVALLVGAIGIANIMVISVLERRGEIGLRRALGARRVHISAQFLTESALLAALGGAAGLGFGAAATWVYAQSRNQPFVVPTWALVAAPTCGLAIGALAGLYPAGKAARLSPSEALRS